MKKRANPRGRQPIGGHILRLKRNDFVEPILRRAAQGSPEHKTTLRLYREAVAAIDKLALNAAGAKHRNGRFAIAMLTPICVETALLVARASDPRLGVEAFLAAAVNRSVQQFAEAVANQPERFVKVARTHLKWPVLWAVKDNAREHKALVEKLQLGAAWQFKAKGAIDLSATATAAVVDALVFLEALQCLTKDNPKLRILDKNTKQPLRPQGRIGFPPPTKEPANIDFWWNEGIKPILEDKRACFETSGALDNYRCRADRAKLISCKSTRTKEDIYRAKTDTLAWNRFLTDCKKALKRLASPVTDKIAKSP